MEEEKAESYRALYRVRPLIYHIGDIRLWVPIRQDGIILWFVYVFVFFIFCYVFPILAWIPLDRIFIMLIGPILAAYYSVKLDPAGKTVPRFLRDVLQFLWRPKWVIGWREVRFSEKRQHLHMEGWCKPYIISDLSGGLQEWRGGKSGLKGIVQAPAFFRLPAHVRMSWKGRSGVLSIVPTKAGNPKSIIVPGTVETRKNQNVHWLTRRSVHIHVTCSEKRRQWVIQTIKKAREEI